MSQALFNPQKLRAKDLRQDDLGFMLVLYELWEQYPHRFGESGVAQLNAKQRIEQLIDAPDTTKFNIAQKLADLFAELDIKPLEGLSVLNISPVTYHKDRWAPLISLCGEYKAIAEAVGTDSETVTIGNIHALSGGMKAHFVITGNVVNYIDAENPEGRLNFMRAAAMATGTGGRTIHLMDLDNDLDNTALNRFMISDKNYEALGQQLLRTIPEDAWRKKGPRPIATVAQQLRALGPDGQEIPAGSIDASTLGLRGRQNIDDSGKGKT